MFTYIVDGDNGTQTYIHYDDRPTVGEENYDTSARTVFRELVKKHEHGLRVKKYSSISRKFIIFFSTSVPFIKENEKQVICLVAMKKESSEGESSNWMLTSDIRCYFVMEDGVVRPTKIGLIIHQDLAIH